MYTCTCTCRFIVVYNVHVHVHVHVCNPDASVLGLNPTRGRQYFFEMQFVLLVLPCFLNIPCSETCHAVFCFIFYSFQAPVYHVHVHFYACHLFGRTCISHCSRRTESFLEGGMACPLTSMHIGILSPHSFSICSCIVNSDCVPHVHVNV